MILCLVHALLFCLFPHSIVLCAVLLPSIAPFHFPSRYDSQERMDCHRGNVIDICFCPIIPRLNLIFAPVFMFEQRVGSVKIASMCFFLAVLLNRVIRLHAIAGHRELA